MKATIAFFIVLGWISGAWAQAASNDGLTSAKAASRGGAVRDQIALADSAEQQEHWADAIAQWRALAVSGVDAATARLCRLYFDGRQGRFDAALTLDWCRRAAGPGDGGALYRLGLLYLVGLGVQPDIEQAHAFCATSTEKDTHEPGKFCLAAIAEERASAAAALADNRYARVAPRDTSEATPKTHAAPSELCETAFLSEAAPFDTDAAVKWCQQAADNGDPAALQRLGTMRLLGLGGPADLDAAEHDCTGALTRGQGRVPTAFCLAAVAALRQEAIAVARGQRLAGDQQMNRPLPKTLPDPFRTDLTLDRRQRTPTGLEFSCRQMADWARFEAPGLGILTPRDKLFGKAVLDYRAPDFAGLDHAAVACADALAGHPETDGVRRDLSSFRLSLADLRTRQASLQAERRQARDQVAQLAANQQAGAGEATVLGYSRGSPQEQACIDFIRRVWVSNSSLGGGPPKLAIESSKLADENGSFVVRGEAQVLDPAGSWKAPFSCSFVGHTQVVATSGVEPAPPSADQTK